MNRRIVYTRSDGGVAVCIPAPAARLPRESEDQFLARVIVKDVPPDASDVRVVDVRELPPDRTFRNAWSLRDGKVGVDMETARNVHRQRLRLARKPLLEAADVEMSRAFNNPDRQAEIEAKRQALRDAPADPAIDAAATPEELAVAWPLPTENPNLRKPARSAAPIQPVPVKKAARWSMAELLQRAAQELPPEPPLPEEPVLAQLEPEPVSEVVVPAEEVDEPAPVHMLLSDSQKRNAARSLIGSAVKEAARKANGNQIRYELALQAKNGQVRAMGLFEEEAQTLGLKIEALVDQVIAERHALERRMMHVHAIEARVLAQIDQATGDDIDILAASAAAEINGG